VVTDSAIYNFKPKSYSHSQRRIPVWHMGEPALVLAAPSRVPQALRARPPASLLLLTAAPRAEGLILSKSSDEVLFQVTNDYDYRFVIQRRAELVEMVRRSQRTRGGQGGGRPRPRC
jgi:hypothetical protein